MASLFEVKKSHVVSNRARVEVGRDYAERVRCQMLVAGFSNNDVKSPSISGKKFRSTFVVEGGTRVLVVHAKASLRERWMQADRISEDLCDYYGKLGFVSVLVSDEVKPANARSRCGMLFMNREEFSEFLERWASEA